MNRAIYNEIEPFAARWLCNLSDAGHIADGVVITDPVETIDAAELKALAPTQFHTFAGIGAWSYALRLAGWPDDRTVWTGSCPCQPFSAAGKGLGEDDPRHLWPAWRDLIEVCSPPTIFGEQVASPAGRAWLDDVSTDLEALGYAVGSADLCAAGVGAPHIRQRLFWVAHAERRTPERHRHEVGGAEGGLVEEIRNERVRHDPGHGRDVDPWAGCDWIPCRDGKARPIEPGTLPLADGAPGRVGRLRAYGNAIVPQVAAAFIQASMLAVLLAVPAPASAQLDVARCVAGELVGFEPGEEARLVVEVLRLRAGRRGSSPDAHARAYCQPLRAPRPGAEWVAQLPSRASDPWPERLPTRYRRRWFRLLAAVRAWFLEPAEAPTCGADHWAAPSWPVDPDHFELVDCGQTTNRFYRWRR